MNEEKRRPGHPAYPPEEKRVTISCRIHPSTNAFLKEHKMKPGRVLDHAVTILKEDGIVDISSWQNSKDV